MPEAHKAGSQEIKGLIIGARFLSHSGFHDGRDGYSQACHREDTQSCRAREFTKVYDRNAYNKEKQEALNAWGARLSRIVSGLELVKAESGEA